MRAFYGNVILLYEDAEQLYAINAVNAVDDVERATWPISSYASLLQ